METYLLEWAQLLVRWLHVIVAIAWIGSSFYFVFLDSNLVPPQDPALKDKLIKLGYEPIGSNSADLAAAQKTDLARWEKPIKATGVQLD